MSEPWKVVHITRENQDPTVLDAIERAGSLDDLWVVLNSEGNLLTTEAEAQLIVLAPQMLADLNRIAADAKSMPSKIREGVNTMGLLYHELSSKEGPHFTESQAFEILKLVLSADGAGGLFAPPPSPVSGTSMTLPPDMLHEQQARVAEATAREVEAKVRASQAILNYNEVRKKAGMSAIPDPYYPDQNASSAPTVEEPPVLVRPHVPHASHTLVAVPDRQSQTCSVCGKSEFDSTITEPCPFPSPPVAEAPGHDETPDPPEPEIEDELEDEPANHANETGHGVDNGS